MFKVTTGFREDQFVLVPADEVHKAYYLFTHPEERAVFSNGVTLIGKNIQNIDIAWNEVMGWNSTHILDNDDWVEINRSKEKKEMTALQIAAKQVSYLMEKDKSLGMKTLTEATRLLGVDSKSKELSDGVKALTSKFRV